jgi:hypothetical protein
MVTVVPTSMVEGREGGAAPFCRCLIRRQSAISHLLANGKSIWVAMVGLDTWVYRLGIYAATCGRWLLSWRAWSNRAQDRLNIGLNPAVQWR